MKWGDVFDFPTSGWTTWQSKVLPVIALGLGADGLTSPGWTRGSVARDPPAGLRPHGPCEGPASPAHRRRLTFCGTRSSRSSPLPGRSLGFLITGSFVIEQIFAIPGIGRYYVTAVTARDYSVVMGLTVLLSIIVIVANMVVDILYGILDPRTREAR